MTLKRLYKRLVPPDVRNRIAGQPWVAHLRNQQLIREGRQLAGKARAARTPDGKIRGTFIVQHPALWSNHASIFFRTIKADLTFKSKEAGIPNGRLSDPWRKRWVLAWNCVEFCPPLAIQERLL